MLRAVLFDLDNTLIDRVSAHRLYCEAFVARHGSQLSDHQRQIAVNEMTLRDRLGYANRGEYFSWMAMRFPEAGRTGRELWQDYRRRLPEYMRPDERINRLVDRITAGYRSAIVTNGSTAMQRAKLSAAGLGDRFSTVVVSQECCVEKPDAGIFRRALNQIDVAPHETLFVGDDPIRDIAGASKLGMRTCWVSLGRTYPTGLRRPDHVVESLHDWDGPK